MQQRKRRFISTETVTSLLVLAGAYAVLPFLYAARYDWPSADDYGFANMFAQHGLGSVWKQQYREWTGRYLMPVFFRMNPTCAHSLAGYRVAACLTLLVFAAVVVGVVRSLTKEYLDGRQALGLGALVVALYLAKAPSIAEAFFWFPGYSIYQYANIFFLLLLAALVKMLRRPTAAQVAPARPTPALLAWCAILCIAIIGCNEVSMIGTTLLVGWLALMRRLESQRRAGTRDSKQGRDPGEMHANTYLGILCAICLVFTAIEIAAPGNYVRLNTQHKSLGSILWTVAGSLSTTAIYGSQWIGALLAATVVYVPVFGMPIARRMTETNRRPALSIRSFAWFLASSLALLQLFILWTANGSDLGRILNVVWLFVIAGYFFLLQLLLCSYAPRLEPLFDRYRNGIALLGLGLFAACLLDINNGISTAYVDILSGKARAYDRELTGRAAQISNCKTDTSRVTALRDAPATLFFTDIRPLNDRQGLWINLYYSQYWHAGFVLPDSAPPTPAPNLETLRNIGKSLRGHIAKKS